MGRLDTLIAAISGSTLVGFVGLVVYAVLVAVGVFDGGGTVAADGGGYGAGATAPAVEGSGAFTYERHEAVADGEPVSYLDFGGATPLSDDGTVAVAPIWVFIDGFDDDGRPQMSTEHRTIVDVLPGDEGYSDLWDVQFVLVPEGFDGDLRSLEELEASGLQTVAPGMLVNCPVAPEGAATSEGHDLRPGWYRGEPFFYFDFGVTTTTPGDVYEFVVRGGSYAPDVPLDVPPLVVLPNEDGAAAQFFRRHEVLVSNEGQAVAIDSAEALALSGLRPRATGELVNRPLIVD